MATSHTNLHDRTELSVPIGQMSIDSNDVLENHWEVR